MLTYGAALEEVPPVKEIILEVRALHITFNKDALAHIENRKTVSPFFLYYLR